MITTAKLNIEIAAFDTGIDIVIEGRHYYLNYDMVRSEPELRNQLASEAAHVYNAVVGLLKEMAS